ncbi:MAG: homocysteine S-methyltransferase family protein [Eubacterium sp.]|nr:homocysteine S-methyltransferase family protein [Eubacterium sp.]
MKFTEALKQGRLYFDGALGSLMQARFKEIGPFPEILSITEPEKMQAIHREYVEAGADVISTNTFGAFSHKLAESGYTQAAVVQAAVDNARAAGARYVALDLSTIGALIGALGEVSFEEAYGYFKELMVLGEQAGADLILIETMTDIYETKAAVLAAKENTSLPVVVSMTFEDNGRTLTGSDPATVVAILDALGVDALGINCSTGPDRMMPIVDEMLKWTALPMIVQPNAGIPRVKDGVTYYDIDADTFADYMVEMAKKGVRLLGGCCGTTPAHIQKMAAATRGLPLPEAPEIPERSFTTVATATRTLVLGQDVRVIGESINPTTNEALKQALRAGDIALVKQLAIAQKNQGAHILDINLGLPDIDEKAMMCRAVEAVSQAVDIPLQIDSSDPEVLEAVLRTYNGKPIINSVNGEASAMERIFPIAKKYGACLLGLTMDDGGIPEKAQKRFEIGRRIVEAAGDYGIPKKNMLLDCLVLTASAQQQAVTETIDALTMIRDHLGVPTVLGVSNISFGLPNRPLMNRTFLTAALTAGLNTPIMNPGDQEMMDAIAAFRALWSYDDSCRDYVAAYASAQGEADKKAKDGVSEAALPDLKTMVVEGMEDEAVEATKTLLKTLSPLEIVDQFLIPGLDVVGEQFETGEAFLPNLIFAAETVQAAFEVIKASLGDQEPIVKGRIILATVAGDVHDIGKNILKVILENYGYEILDLGKDVPEETIVETVKAEGIRLVGLSALMTTTVKNMATAVESIHSQCPGVAVMVGGAVLNPEYAKSIGADFYGKDAKAGVSIAQGIFEEM